MTPTLVTFVFDSTNGALWAEEIARELLVPVEATPAPPGSDALCDLALIARSDDADRLERAWAEAGVPFRLWSGAAT